MSAHAIHRARVLAVALHLRALGLAARPRRAPKPRRPDAIEREYHRALMPIVDAAREELERVASEILRGLGALRSEQGKRDAVEGRSYLRLLAAVRAHAASAGATTTAIADSAVGPILVLELPGDPLVVVVAGQHGDEQGGPGSWLRHGRDIFAAARSLGVGLRVYPCANPEGYETGRRRDLDGDRTANAFLEYLVAGRWAGELAPGETSDATRRPHCQAPETRALYDDLAPIVERRRPLAVVDQHGDSLLGPGEAFAYAFSSGRRAIARALRAAAEPFAGQRLENGGWSAVPARTDREGIVELRDGSITDWADRAGVAWSACVETTVEDLADAAEVHARFVRTILRLAAGARHMDAGSGSEARDLVDRAARRFVRAFRPRDLEHVARRFGERVDRFQRDDLDDRVKAALGVSLGAVERSTRDRIEEWAAVNVDLVTTVPERYFDRMRLDVEDAYARGTHPRELAKQMAEVYEISGRDAMRIARDQVGKLNGQLNRDRQEALGVAEYTWRIVHDNRVRDEHAERDGERFSWDDAPDGGHPGEDIQCRCFADPVLGDGG